MGFLFFINTASKTSWLEQMLEALNADDKNLLSEYHYMLFNSLESAQRTSKLKHFVVNVDCGYRLEFMKCFLAIDTWVYS